MLETSDFASTRSFIKRQTGDTLSGNEWQREVQRVTASDNEWQQVTTNDKEWQQLTTSGTSDNEWQRVVILNWFLFFRIREELTIMHPKQTLQTLRKILKRDYWIKSRNKPLRRNINRKKQESRQSFLFVIHTNFRR